MEMTSETLYKLELENQKRNVFVTQLQERDDEEDVAVFPVVKESGDRLIETGINTLQKTLLLKKEVEVDKVNAELEAKRREFKQRMEVCAQRQAEVKKKQQQMKDRVSKFEKFIQENDAKRQRAIHKYQFEMKQRDQKAIEFSSISDELQQYKTRHAKLQTKLKIYKVFEEYLQNVIEAMPEDYLPAGEDRIKSLMMRHNTLSESNRNLVNNLDVMADELENYKKTLEMMNQEHQKSCLSRTSQLSHLQSKQEQIQDKNEQLEQMLAVNRGEARAKSTEIGHIFMAIDSMYEKSRKLSDPPANSTDWDQKLTRIRDHLYEREGVLSWVHSCSVIGGPAPDIRSRSRSRERTALKFTVTDH